MRTNIDIDEDLPEQAFSVSRMRTKIDLIHEALKEFIRLKKRKDLTELAGFIELRKSGVIVRSPIDCCIACIAMEARALLLHRDQDFEKIASLAPLKNEFFTP